MEKENIIISIIIVLCIAAAVAAYGITNSDGPIFSDLSSMSASDNKNPGHGIGNSTAVINGSGSSASTATSDGGSGGSGSGDGSGSGSGTGDGSGSNSGSNDNGGCSQNSQSSTVLSYSEAQSIADSAVGEPGCYAGSVSYSDGYWYATIYDENGTAVDSIGIDDATGSVSRM